MQTMRHIAFASFEAQRPLHEGSLPGVNGKCFHAVVWGQKKSHAVYVCVRRSVRLSACVVGGESILYYAIYPS